MGPAEHSELSLDDGRPTAGTRPEHWPQGKVERHSGIGYEVVLALDALVLQLVEQLPDVILSRQRWAPRVAFYGTRRQPPGRKGEEYATHYMAKFPKTPPQRADAKTQTEQAPFPQAKEGIEIKYALVIEYVAPTLAVSYAAPAPVIERVASSLTPKTVGKDWPPEIARYSVKPESDFVTRAERNSQRRDHHPRGAGGQNMFNV